MNRKLNILFIMLLGLVLSACAGNKKEQVVEQGGGVGVGSTTATDIAGDPNNAFNTGYSVEELQSLGIEGNPLNYNILYFEYNRSDLDERSKIIAAAHARNVAARGGAQITLGGHTDERGTRDYNLALGERRSKEVANYMRAQGVGTSSINTLSYGEERPVDSSHNESAWQKNRRVVMSFSF